MHAIVAAPGGGIYAATSPDGKIYKVDAAGTGTVFFDPPDRYIWSLAVDRAGNVYAGTGDKGIIYKIGADGRGAPFYQTKATHVMSLAFDREGRLLAGTESPGRVFQIDASGKPFVLLDSPYNEIHTLRVDANGNIYAAAVSGRGARRRIVRRRRRSPSPAQQPIASVSTEVTSITIVADASAAVGGAGSAGRAARQPGTRRRRGVSHHAGRRLGSPVAAARRRAVRPGVRGGRQRPRRHRQRGQDLPARRATRCSRRSSRARSCSR